MKVEDRIGTVINGWKIIEITGKDKYRNILFKAVSTITNKVITNARIDSIKRSAYSHESKRDIKAIHKWTNSRLQLIFNSIKARCYNPKHTRYKCYGAKNITICQEWLQCPKAFEEWALENGYQDDLTIDRIDVKGNYEPNNCRWISRGENSKWKRSTCKIWIGNYVDSMQGWSQKVGKRYSWFGDIKRRHGLECAYQCLLEEIERLGGIKKVMGIREESDISQFLEDIENDCLEVD